MEPSINAPVLIQMEDENQIVIFLINTFYSALHVLVNFSIVAMNIFFSPFVWTYMFWAYAINKSWQIVKHIGTEIYDLLKIIPLGIEVCLWSVACCVMPLLFIKSWTETSALIEEKIYKKLKKILQKLHALPFTPKHAASLNTILKKLPIFGKGLLPYPDFLFEETFTNINYRNGAVSITLPVPPETVQESGTEIKPPVNSSTPATPDPASTSRTTPVINEPKPETDPVSGSSSDHSTADSDEKSYSSI